MADRRTDKSLPALTFVLGGVRSGKSAFAEALVEATAKPVYIATAEALDGEMSDRIRLHRERRGARWQTVEEPLDLGAAIARHAGPQGAVLVDCLTLWLSNLMHAGRDVDRESRLLIESLATVSGPVVIVSNEVGLGVTPDNALSRRYLDLLGRLHQLVAGQAAEVYFVVAGIATPIKTS